MPAGMHTGPTPSPDLVDARADFIADGVQVGHTIDNITDGSSAIITAVTATTITGVLAGGTDNVWVIADVYLTTP